jgi:hypothetical protein
VQLCPARPVYLFKGVKWVRTDTMYGGLERITRVRWRRNSETYPVTSFGLTKLLIAFCIFTASLLVSRRLGICGRLSIFTTRDFVPVPDDWSVMNEQNRIKCRNCGEWCYYTPANTVIYWWPEYLWYSVAQTVCDHCDYRQACFLLDNLEWELNWAIANDLGFVEMEGLPQDDVLEAFKEIYPNHITYHELSANEQAWVDYLAYLLDTVPQDEWFNP